MGQYSSFIVRVWSDGLENIRGNIEHVATHERHVFVNPEEIVQFVRAHLALAASPAGFSRVDADKESVLPNGQPSR